MAKRKLSQSDFATSGAAGRGGPQANGKMNASIQTARYGRSNTGAVSPQRLGGGSKLQGKPAK